MNLTPEQIAAAQKANLETLSGLTSQALQSIETQDSFTKSAEKEFAAGQKKMNALVEEWTKHAPPGSDVAVQALKQAIASANNVYETSQKAVKHAVEVAQSNMNTAADAVTKSTSAASKASKKKS